MAYIEELKETYYLEVSGIGVVANGDVVLTLWVVFLIIVVASTVVAGVIAIEAVGGVIVVLLNILKY